jgi:ribosomal protein L11 methyltransferase
MQSTICLAIRNINQQQAEELMALLGEEGFEAFEETENGLDAYIPEEKFDEAVAKSIISTYTSDISINVHAPRNWNAEWEQQYQPVVVEDIIGIRASFHAPLQQVQTEIIITPKMSFGTGHHATTWQMLKMMSELDFRGWNVFDYGTGTGVLAVYAELLGASKLLAMDIDDWCIENTIENASVNQCESILALQGTVPPSDQAFDCILANINRHILLENMVAMAGSLRSGGLLLISGFYAEEDHLLIEAAEKQCMFFEKNSEKSGWSCLQFRKN